MNEIKHILISLISSRLLPLYIMNKKCPRLAACLDWLKYDKELVIDEATRFHWIYLRDLVAWNLSSQSNHALSFYWTVKNFYNSSGNQNRKTLFYKLKISITWIQRKKKLWGCYKQLSSLGMPSGGKNNQPTRINLLINFNSSREEPGGFISSVRGGQGSIWLETRLM